MDYLDISRPKYIEFKLWLKSFFGEEAEVNVLAYDVLHAVETVYSFYPEESWQITGIKIESPTTTAIVARQ